MICIFLIICGDGKNVSLLHVDIEWNLTFWGTSTEKWFPKRSEIFLYHRVQTMESIKCEFWCFDLHSSFLHQDLGDDKCHHANPNVCWW
jgi:hypothetical protein